MYKNKEITLEDLKHEIDSIRHTMISDKWLIGDHAARIINLENFMTYVEKMLYDLKSEIDILRIS